MKKGKRALSLVLGLVLACALAAPARAADTPEIVWLDTNVIPGDIVALRERWGYPAQEVQKDDPIIVLKYVERENGSGYDRYYAYVDTKGNYIVSPTIWGSSSVSQHPLYSEGLLPVVTWASTGIPEKCEYVDKKGKTVLTLEASVLGQPFAEDRAAVCKFDEFGNAKWGFIDRDGKAITLYKYDEVEPYSNGVAHVKENGSWGYIDLAGQYASAPEGETTSTDSIRYALRHVYGYSYEWVENIDIYGISEGMVRLREGYRDSDGQWRHRYYYMDIDDMYSGDALIELPYDGAYGFSEGLAPVGMWTEDGEDFVYGYADKTGALVIPMEYCVGSSWVSSEDVGTFTDGMAKVRKRNSEGELYYGWINTAGETVIPFEYEAANEFSNGLAAVRKDKKWGFIDQTGQEVIPGEYDGIRKAFSGGLAVVQQDGKYGFINEKGEIVVPIEYDSAYDWDYPIMMDGYIGTVCQVKGNNLALYGIFVNPESPLAKETSPLGGLFSGNSSEGNDGASSSPLLPVAGVLAAAVAGGLVLLKKKKRPQA